MSINDRWFDYIDIDISSCKLLLASGCGYRRLLNIACGLNNYESTRYIIDNMTESELYEFITSVEHINTGINDILIIDKIYSTHSERLISLLNSYEIDRNNQMIVRCYKIIKYLTLTEGKELMTNINKNYESRLCKIHNDNTRSDNQRNKIKTAQSLHNELLVYHFTPRGSHTKSARTTF
jgi:hypothetical protein